MAEREIACVDAHGRFGRLPAIVNKDAQSLSFGKARARHVCARQAISRRAVKETICEFLRSAV